MSLIMRVSQRERKSGFINNFAILLTFDQGYNTDLTLTFTYPLAAVVLGAPYMTSRPVSSLPSGTWRTPGLSIP